MKIAVTGSNGLLGQHLVQLLLSADYAVIAIGRGPDRTQFSQHSSYTYFSADIASPVELHDCLSGEKPDVLIHAAAMTQLDECELNKSACDNINRQGTMHAIAVAEQYCSHFIYVSTDFVFDGVKGNYCETDYPNPVSHYGSTKQLAEQLVEQCKIPWAIVRTCLVFGNTLAGSRTNIVSWVKQNLENATPIRVVNDQFRTPTYVGDLAKGILLAVQREARGIYHISGAELMTPYDIAVATADYFGLSKEYISAVDASTFTQPARRPPRTGFDISKAKKDLGFEPIPFKEGLAKMWASK